MWRKRRQSKYSSISTWALGLHFFLSYISQTIENLSSKVILKVFTIFEIASQPVEGIILLLMSEENLRISFFYAKIHGNIVNLTLRLFSVFIDFKEERNFVFSLRINMTMTNRISEVALSSSWWVWRHIQI